jgi:hypothetical protein
MGHQKVLEESSAQVLDYIDSEELHCHAKFCEESERVTRQFCVCDHPEV